MNYPGSVSELGIFWRSEEFHLSQLRKISVEEEISEVLHHDRYPLLWPPTVDKGYQGAVEILRIIYPKIAPRGGCTTVQELQNNQKYLRTGVLWRTILAGCVVYGTLWVRSISGLKIFMILSRECVSVWKIGMSSSTRFVKPMVGYIIIYIYKLYIFGTAWMRLFSKRQRKGVVYRKSTENVAGAS